MATTVVASRTSTLLQTSTDDAPASALSFLSLNAAPSTLTFFPTLPTPPSSPPLNQHKHSTNDPPAKESASSQLAVQKPFAPTILPEPSPPLTPPPSFSLSVQINLATRPIHTRLNRRILDLLPLALPPHAEAPELYVRGMEAVGGIYLALEETVQRARGGQLKANGSDDMDCCGCKSSYPDNDGETTSHVHDHELGSGKQQGGGPMGRQGIDLGQLDLTGLLGRAGRLENDLHELNHRVALAHPRSGDGPLSKHSSPTKAAPADTSTQQYPQQEEPTGEAKYKSTALTALTHQIHSFASIGDGSQHHHLLLTPLHQFTLALFNGGRHIRRQLFSAPANFWIPSPPSSYLPPIPSPLPTPSPFTLATATDPSHYFTAIPQAQPRDKAVDHTAGNVLTFWHIPDHDEGDVKRGFKRTFESVAATLTAEEREDVVNAAVTVMQMLESVIEEIVYDVEAKCSA